MRKGVLRSSRKKRLKIKTLFLMFIMLAMFTFLFIIVDSRASPIIQDIAVDKAKNIAMQAINNSVDKVIKEDDENHRELADYRFDENGNIISVNTNINLTNAIEGKILDNVVKEINHFSRCPISVPIGTLTGSDLLTGRGPDLTFYISLSGNARSSIENLFESTGINQSRHQIQIRVEADISILTAGKRMTASVENTIVIGETIIVGQIPDAYMGTNS